VKLGLKAIAYSLKVKNNSFALFSLKDFCHHAHGCEDLDYHIISTDHF